MNRAALLGILAFGGIFFAFAVLFSAGPGVSQASEDKDAAANAQWARHLDELFTPGHQIQTGAGESLWIIRPLSVDPRTGIEDRYDTRAAENCFVGTDQQCTKRLAAQGKILSLPPASLVEIVKRDRASGAGMVEVRVLRMGQRATTRAERARAWWMCDIDLEDPDWDGLKGA